MKTKEELSALVSSEMPFAKTFVKQAFVQATQCTKEETLTTRLSDGMAETVNTAFPGNWIVTNPSGEQYILTEEKFKEKYIPAKQKGVYVSKPIPQKFIQIKEDIEFMAPPQFIKKGGFLNVSDLENVYGVAQKEFLETYSPFNPVLLNKKAHSL
ncbi:MAG: hypothetical protein EOM53_05320 [Alphaproteobacteria bacterium]|nr:hypothetical protein [Alphaproteobacteria bacterium]